MYNKTVRGLHATVHSNFNVSKLEIPINNILDQVIFDGNNPSKKVGYLPPSTKLRQGNVFTPVWTETPQQRPSKPYCNERAVHILLVCILLPKKSSMTFK